MVQYLKLEAMVFENESLVDQGGTPLCSSPRTPSIHWGVSFVRIDPGDWKLPQDNQSVSGLAFTASSYILVLRYKHTCSWGRMLRSRCHPGVRWRCRRHQLSLTKSWRRQPLLTSMVLCLTPLARALISHFLHYWGHLTSVKPRHLLLIIISRKKVSTLLRSPKERGGRFTFLVSFAMHHHPYGQVYTIHRGGLAWA